MSSWDRFSVGVLVIYKSLYNRVLRLDQTGSALSKPPMHVTLFWSRLSHYISAPGGALISEITCFPFHLTLCFKWKFIGWFESQLWTISCSLASAWLITHLEHRWPQLGVSVSRAGQQKRTHRVATHIHTQTHTNACIVTRPPAWSIAPSDCGPPWNPPHPSGSMQVFISCWLRALVV